MASCLPFSRNLFCHACHFWNVLLSVSILSSASRYCFGPRRANVSHYCMQSGPKYFFNIILIRHCDGWSLYAQILSYSSVYPRTSLTFKETVLQEFCSVVKFSVLNSELWTAAYWHAWQNKIWPSS